MVRPLIAALMCLVSACGGSAATSGTSRAVTADGSWHDDFFPERREGEAVLWTWGTYHSLAYDHRVFASNSDDMSSQVVTRLDPV